MPAPTIPPVSRRLALALALIVLTGATLRLWGLDAGAPFRMSVDEPIVLTTSMRIVKTGDFNPHFFDYGGLTFYLHGAVTAVAFLAGAMEGRWSALETLWEGDILVASRTVTALLGALTVVLVFRAGLRWGPAAGLLAALALAFHPQHVRESHLALTDTPLTLLTTAVLLLSLRAAERATTMAFVQAGLMVGFTAAIKYNGGLALLMPLLATFALPYGRRATAALIVMAASAGGFLVAAPYSLLDLPNFLNGFAAVMQSYNQRRPLGTAMGNYVAYLRNGYSWPGILPLQFGYLALAVMLAGAVRLIRRPASSPSYVATAVLLVFPAAYFWFVSTQGSLQYGRYLLPMAPMLAICLGIGVGVVSSAISSRWQAARRVSLPLLSFLLLAPAAANTIAWNVSNARTTTTEQAASWVLRQVKPAEAVVIEASAVHLPPHLKVTHVTDLISRTADEYAASGVVYLVASSARSGQYYADRRTEQIAAYRNLLAVAEVVATFVPSEATPGPTMTVLRLGPRQ